jgi:gas vesicle protein
MKTFLAGLGTGYAIGALFAPKPGSETRRDLRRTAGKLGSVAGDQGGRLRKVIGDPRQLLQRAKQQAEPYIDQAQEVVSKATEQLKTAQSVASKAGAGPLMMLNVGSREDLMSVYGIGPILADKIINGRPYTSEREVVDRNIISENILKELARSMKSA